MKLRLGTRGSELARTQSGHVAVALEALGHEVELVTIRSQGDVTTGSLLDAGGLGLFAAALRVALLGGEVDLVVHSLKDLPTAPVDGLTIAALPERELPFDALCARDGLTLDGLPPMARVGTGSPRRAAQVRARRPDLSVVEIRGNVGTRLGRVHGDAAGSGDLDAVVLARAGLARLGRFDAITDTLDLLPAPGQGALAVECRAGDEAVRAALAPLDHAETRLCVSAERAVLAALQAGCAAPVAAYGRVVNGHLEFTASVFSADGARQATARTTTRMPADPATVGGAAAAELLARGAAEITPLGATRESRLEAFHTDTGHTGAGGHERFHHERALWAPGTEEVLVGRRVLLPRAEGELARAIRAAGADVDAVQVTEPRALAFTMPARADWLILTSAAGVVALTDAGVDLTAAARRIAAVGRATASAAESAGAVVSAVPSGRSDADSLLDALLQASGPVPSSAIVAGSALSGPRLAEGLAARGWQVEVVHTYTTVALADAPLTRPWADYDAIVLTSGSIARATVALLGPPDDRVAVIALGRPSAEASAAAGLRVDAVAATQDGPGVVDALTRALAQEQP
ncbi:MAG: hydroxymethylbilane synthase [Nigerium sp.]|nr:hydroxymethylbilane synthase [Nigerium sp.]